MRDRSPASDDAPERMVIYTQALGVVGIVALLIPVMVDTAGSCVFLCEDRNLWVKVVGFLCAAIFGGAAILEVQQIFKARGYRGERGLLAPPPGRLGE